MKTLSHILIILIAASIVGGILFAAVNNNTSNAAPAAQRGGSTEFRSNDNFASRERDSRGFNSLSLFTGTIGELLVISGITIVWLYAGKLFNKVKAI